ncbi:MAG: ATP-binding protein, partial [Verrucomicrobiota bacterium]
KNAADTIIGAVMVFHDVTERRQKELALQRSYQAEQEARAVAEHASQAKDHFLAALSHELRTPLTPVLAILSTLREETAIPEVFAEDLETVRRNVELEARLIDDLLDLTRITQGKLHLHYKPVAVSQLIEDAINTCLPDLRLKRLTLTRQLIEPHPTVEVDGARVTQILWNLLKNAIKFTPTKGAITIRLSTTGKQNARQLVIEVQDTGIGLEPADLERIFQAFEQGGRTTSRQFGGLGLGLAISRAIAEAHRGTLFALSEGKGCGSTFILTIPWAGHESPNAMEPAVSGSRPFLFPAAGNVLERPLRILLVEDHEDTAIIMARLLRRMGHDVMHAGTVHAAIALADQEMQSGRIDLLMSDLGLPDGSGQDLMRILCSRYQLKGIALSGYGMESDLEESMAAGFARHLIKPIDIALLRNTIAELMYP